MKFYILNVISKIQNFSKKLDETALIENNHWVYIDDLNFEKKVYIFRPNGQLLISTNGIVSKSSWEYLGSGSFLIDLSMKFIINNEYVARIVEGCNAISVMILFVAFIIAFHSNFKKTFLFGLTGAILIYALNIIRVALLCIGIHEYPEYASFLHDIVFPGFIYGLVFLLWMLWVRMNTKTKTTSS